MAATLNLEVASLSVATLAVLEVDCFPLAALEVAMALLEAENAPLAMAPLETNPPLEVAMAPLALESESPRRYPVVQTSGLRSTN